MSPSLSIPGPILRPYRGPSDLPDMLRVLTLSEAVDGEDCGATLETMAHSYAGSEAFAPQRDAVIVEVAGTVAGYARVRWWSEINDGPLIYETFGCLAPKWRRRGIGRAMLQWLEQRTLELAAGQPAARAKYLRAVASPAQTGRLQLFGQHGYQPVRHSHIMLRSTLDDLPDFPLPEGVALRPASPEHYRQIWEAARDAFTDHWGAGEQVEADYQEWLNDPILMQPALWQIAWDTATDQIVGQVRTFINHAENEKYQRQRGFTEFISVAGHGGERVWLER